MNNIFSIPLYPKLRKEEEQNEKMKKILTKQ